MFEFMYSWIVLGAAACGSTEQGAQRPEAHGPGHHGSGHHGHDHHQHGQHGHASGDPGAGHRGHGHHAHDHSFTNAEEWAKRFDDPARDEWQKPDEVVRALALTPSSIVADVGAGTGYFAVRLARVVTKGEVIATDLEPDMVRYLTERAQREKLSNLRAVRASATASGLAPSSVDAILVVDVWHHIADRVAYARDLAAALRPGGRVLIVDFRLDATMGPPPSMRLAPEAIVADLRAAGLDATVSPVALPQQYIVEARRAAR